MNQLLPCPHCSRHHRVCEHVCPFCGGPLPACQAAPPAHARGRLNRATLFAAGAALLGGANCDNRSTSVHYGLPGIVTNPDGSGDTSNAPDATGDGSMRVSIVTHYGLPGMPFPADDSADASDGGDAEIRDASGTEDGKAAQDATDATDGGAEGT